MTNFRESDNDDDEDDFGGMLLDIPGSPATPPAPPDPTAGGFNPFGPPPTLEDDDPLIRPSRENYFLTVFILKA